MPKMVMVVPDPEFQPASAAQKAAFASLIPQKLAWIQAVENVRRMGGMLKISSEEPVQGEVAMRLLDDLSIDELKLHMLTLGIKPTKKKMDRREMVTIIRSKLDEIEVEEEDAA